MGFMVMKLSSHPMKLHPSLSLSCQPNWWYLMLWNPLWNVITFTYVAYHLMRMKLIYTCIENVLINFKAFISHTIVHNKFYVLNWFYLHIILLIRIWHTLNRDITQLYSLYCFWFAFWRCLESIEKGSKQQLDCPIFNACFLIEIK